MTRDRKEIEAALLKKGFRNRQSDHKYFIYHTTQRKSPLRIMATRALNR